MKGYGPADSAATPRFSGIATFLRLPHTKDLYGVDVAVVGLPFDTGVSFRVGARFGPKALREGSMSFRPDYNPEQAVALFERLSVIDYGDAPVVPGATVPSYDRMAAALRTLHEAGVVPLGFGGDHGVLLPELRAAAATHGPLAVVQFDSHCDTRDEYFGEKYTHGTVLRRAVEEGLIDPARLMLYGHAWRTTGPDDHEEPRASRVHRDPLDGARAAWHTGGRGSRRAGRGQGLDLRHRSSSTRPTRPAPARRSAAGRHRCRPWRCCAPAAAYASSAPTSSRCCPMLTAPTSRRCLAPRWPGRSSALSRWSPSMERGPN